MRSKVYRALYILSTGFLAMLIALPIIEKKGLDMTLLDDASAVLFWIIGFALMFSKKYFRLGMFFAFFPILFILIAIIS